MSDSPAENQTTPVVDENQLIAERRGKLKALREAQAQGKGVAFPNDFKPEDHAGNLTSAHGEKAPEALKGEGVTPITAKIAGRMMLKRVMGKASFATLQDATGRFQIYVTRDDIGEEAYNDFKHWDLGDIVAAEGYLFKTKMGELSLHASRVRMLTKSLRPMPDKFHGVVDQEIKYRQRYVDLMMDETLANVSQRAAKLSVAFATSWSSTTSWKLKRPCCTLFLAAPTHAHLPHTTMRLIKKCSCALRLSCT
jgi:lysyl-tRNA synthetase, class II